MTDTTTQHTIDVAGYPTTIRRRGDGRAVLYLHGAFFPTSWWDFHDAMADRFDLIAPLHPGYAEGNPPGWLRGWDDLVLHYRDLLDVLSLDRVDLVGYDLGGWLGARLAVTHPERFRSFTAAAAPGLRLPDAPMFEYLAASPQRVMDALFNGDPSGFEHLFGDPDNIDSFVEAYGHDGVTARLIWERRYDVGLERRLSRLRVPTLIITPEEDHLLPVAHAHRWAELVPGARLEVVSGVGHALLVQSPEEIAATIATFIEEIEESST